MNKGTIAFLTAGGTAVVVALVCAIALVMAWTNLRDTTEERDTAIARGNALFADKEQLIADLQSTQGELTAQQRQNTELRDTNGGLQENIAGLDSTIEGLEDDVSGLEMTKEGLERTIAGLETANADLAMDLSDARDRNANLEDANKGLQTDLTDAQAENASLETRNHTLRDDLEAANSDLKDLQEASGTVAHLQARAQGIRDEIKELEEKLRPLTIGWDSRALTSFKCTGSMEPTITCLDDARWITEFEPSVIVEGSIISFTPDCQETHATDDGGGTAHRAVDIKVEDDVYYFWPRGDGNLEDDGCWIPHGNVAMYVVDIIKDVWPQKAPLRDSVLAARDAYREASTAYEDAFVRYCGFSAYEGRPCSLPAHQHRVTSALWDTLNEADDNYNCWLDVARRTDDLGNMPHHTCTETL